MSEAYRMSLIKLPTIELTQLILETKREIDKHKEKKVETKHNDTDRYLFHHRELKRLGRLMRIQKDELQSRQMKLWD